MHHDPLHCEVLPSSSTVDEPYYAAHMILIFLEQLRIIFLQDSVLLKKIKITSSELILYLKIKSTCFLKCDHCV